MYLTLVDRSMRPVFPEADTLTVRTTCSNRNLPARLPFGNEDGDFELETNAPIKRIMALRRPTSPLRPSTDRAALWQLVSHLSLNYLSLVSEGREALQQILRLYDFTDSPVTQRMIEGIAATQSRPHFARLVSENGISFARGTRVELDLDEEQFVGGGVVPVRQRDRTVPGALRFAQQLHAAGRRPCVRERRFCANGHPGRDRTS